LSLEIRRNVAREGGVDTLNWDERKAIDQKHLANPKIGDYWNEMFNPVCVVVGRNKSVLTICKTIEDVDGGWTWDLSRLEKIELSKFAKWLSYGTIPGTWAHVCPKSHKWAYKAIEKAGLI
jgi:hypothetical protein